MQEENVRVMSGEAYVQFILDQLNEVEVHGIDNIERMRNAIHFLEQLRDDVIASKSKEKAAPTEAEPM